MALIGSSKGSFELVRVVSPEIAPIRANYVELGLAVPKSNCVELLSSNPAT